MADAETLEERPVGGRATEEVLDPLAAGDGPAGLEDLAAIAATDLAREEAVVAKRAEHVVAEDLGQGL